MNAIEQIQATALTFGTAPERIGDESLFHRSWLFVHRDILRLGYLHPPDAESQCRTDYSTQTLLLTFARGRFSGSDHRRHVRNLLNIPNSSITASGAFARVR